MQEEPNAALVLFRTAAIALVLGGSVRVWARSTRRGDWGRWGRWGHCGGWQRALWLSVVVSAAMGFEYVAFQVGPRIAAAEGAGSATIHHYYGATAAALFAAAQAVAAFHVARGDRRFLGWLLPAAAYLFAIGWIGWLRFDVFIMVFADTARAVLLLGLAAACLRPGALTQAS